MLEAIAVILILMWALGMGVGYTLGGLLHILLVIAVIAILFRVIRGGKVL